MRSKLQLGFLTLAITALLGLGFHGCVFSGDGNPGASSYCFSFISKLNRLCLEPELSKDALSAYRAQKCPPILDKINCNIKAYYSCALDQVLGPPCDEAAVLAAVAANCVNPCPDLLSIDPATRALCPANEALTFNDIANIAPLPTKTPNFDPTAGPVDATPTSEPTAAAEPQATVAPTVASEFPGLALDVQEINFSHIVFQTQCPQNIGIFNVINDGSASGIYTITVDTQALSIDLSQFTLAPGQSQSITTFFSCSQTSSFTGNLSVQTDSGNDFLEQNIKVNGNVSFSN